MRRHLQYVSFFNCLNSLNKMVFSCFNPPFFMAEINSMVSTNHVFLPIPIAECQDWFSNFSSVKSATVNMDVQVSVI